MSLVAGARLGPYEIQSPIGAGGMGEVYKARDTRLDRTVAIKVLPAATALDPERRARFEREAKTIGGLNHPHICMLHDVGDHGGSLFLVMEHVAGETLAARLKRGPLPLDQAVAISTQIADALAAAHRQGVIHRDLKPGNVMLTRAGAKLLDFGLAKLHVPASASRFAGPSTVTEPITERGALLGTVPYMAPEQLEGKETDARSDIFSFGAMLYEMLAGKRAFEGQSQASVVAAILTSEPTPVSTLQPVTPPSLDRVVRKCLQKDPEARWQSASDIADELRWLASGSGSVSGVAIVPPARRKRRRVPPIAFGIAALLLALAAVWWLSGPSVVNRLFRGTGGGTIDALAVLPLENLSADAGQGYFADGMTEALIADLGSIGSLRVTSRTSVMQYKGAKRSLPDIARALDVDAVVEGSVMRAGERVRITAQLIDARTDRHLWAQSYERDLRDVLALQREVARTIASEISARLTPQEQARLARAGRVDPIAYEAYLRGRHECSAETAAGFESGIRWLEESIARDPMQATTYATLAGCYSQFSFYGLAPSEAFPKSRAAAVKAVELDDAEASGHAALGYAKLNADWDWKGAERDIRRALELDPNSPGAHAAYAYYLIMVPRYDEALAELGRRLALDPVSFSTADHATIIYILARRYDEAIAQAKRALGLAPGSAAPHSRLAWLYLRTSRYRDAVATAERARKLLAPGKDGAFDAFLAEPYVAAGRRADVQAWLATWERQAASGYVDGYNLAALAVALGERDKAFAWLKRGCDQRSPSMLQLKTDPWFDPIRSDVRFEDLLRRVGFP